VKLPDLPEARGILVTGTDTGVGKTWVAAGLTYALRRQGLRAVYFKPVQSGCPREQGRLIPTDARFAQELAGLAEPLEVLTPVALELPLAPGVAAARARVKVDLARIAAVYRELAAKYEFMVVEGAGGLYVPLVDTRFLVLDLARWLRLPLVVVARAGLGTINHTALTVMAARHHGITVAGVVLNRYPATPGLAEQTNPQIIEEITGVPILGLVPEVSDLAASPGRQAFLAALAKIAAQLAPRENAAPGPPAAPGAA
jgi:dethiobiotin synthetase